MDNTWSDEEEDDEHRNEKTRNSFSSSASFSSSENSSERELTKEISRRLPRAEPQTIKGLDDSDFLDEPVTRPDNLAAGDIRWLYNKQTGTINVFSKMVEKEKRYEQKLVLPVDQSIRESKATIGFHLHRNIFSQAFHNLTFDDLNPNSSPPSAHPAYLSNNEKVYLHDGRYESEFDEIRIIGRGGFAKVMEALHKVDKQRYAVKRIPVKSPGSITLEKLSQEVTILAKLTKSPSPRIVRYHAAWLEEEYITRNRRSRSPHNAIIPAQPESSSSEEDNPEPSQSSYIVFEDTSDGAKDTVTTEVSSTVLPLRPHSNGTSRNGTSLSKSIHIYEKEEVLVRSGADSARLFQESEARVVERENYRQAVAETVALRRPRRHQRRRHSSQPMTRYILYIQMELCGKTLSEWLKQRNGRGENNGQFACVSHRNNIHILRQILEGIHFVHEQDILHRDLKPLNVFLTMPHLDVKIGDFGLAREVICNDEEEDIEAVNTKSIGRQLSTDIGTSPYIAPEQQQGGDYDSKADMYSFGIIKYEMFHPFQTGHERIACIRNLREEGHIADHLISSWPEEAEMIQRLTSVDKLERPSASDVLNASCYCIRKEQTKANLQKELSSRDLLISEKDRELALRHEELGRITSEKNRLLEENDRAVREKRRMSREVAEKVRIIEEKERILKEKDRRMSELEDQIKTLQLRQGAEPESGR